MAACNDLRGKRRMMPGMPVAAALFMLFVPVHVLAAPAVELARTGQITCWGADEASDSCTSTGQDGDVRAGVAWPEPRFVDNGDGTISDRLTDLVWLKNADCFGATTWQQALDHGSTLAAGACGLADGSTAGSWRLPNRKELLSIISFEQANGAAWFDGQGFVGGIHGWYWTSDSYAPNPAAKWVVHTVGAAWADNNPQITTPDFHVIYVRDPGVPALTITPLEVNFGEVLVDDSSRPMPLTLHNTGTAPLSIASGTIGGPDASMFGFEPGTGLDGTCGTMTPTLAAGRSCSVSVAFTPTASGVRSAVLSVLPQGGAAVNVSLGGTGFQPVHRVSASTADNSGTVSPVTSEVSSGETVAMTVTASTGYHVDSVVGGTCPGGSFTGTTYTTGAVTADCTAIFSFSPSLFTVSTVFNGDGSVVCLPGTTAQFQTPVSCTITPAVGNSITGIAIDGTSFQVPDPVGFSHSFGPLTADHAIMASFSPMHNPMFTVTHRAADHGTINPPDPQTALAGSAITLTVTPARGYHLASISGCGGTLHEDRFTTAPLTADCSVAARFEPDTLADAIKAFRSILGLASLTPLERHRYDVAPLGAGGAPEPDGAIGVGDIVVMLRRLTGLIDW